MSEPKLVAKANAHVLEGVGACRRPWFRVHKGQLQSGLYGSTRSYGVLYHFMQKEEWQHIPPAIAAELRALVFSAHNKRIR